MIVSVLHAHTHTHTHSLAQKYIKTKCVMDFSDRGTRTMAGESNSRSSSRSLRTQVVRNVMMSRGTSTARVIGSSRVGVGGTMVMTRSLARRLRYPPQQTRQAQNTTSVESMVPGSGSEPDMAGNTRTWDGRRQREPASSQPLSSLQPEPSGKCYRMKLEEYIRTRSHQANGFRGNQADKPHAMSQERFNIRGVDPRDSTVTCMDLYSTGKRHKITLQLIRMEDLHAEDSRECPICCDEYDKGCVDCVASGTSLVPEDKALCAAVMPCGHMFSGIPLLYYMATESMRCPMCRYGCQNKTLRISCLPDHLSPAFQEKVRENLEREIQEQEEASLEAAAILDAEIELLPDMSFARIGIGTGHSSLVEDSSSSDDDTREAFRRVIIATRRVLMNTNWSYSRAPFPRRERSSAYEGSETREGTSGIDSDYL